MGEVNDLQGNEDLDCEPALTPAAEMRLKVRKSDGVVFATPEYNHGIPGVHQNELDWASRPPFASCFGNMPVVIVTSASDRTGEIRAQYSFRETPVSVLAHAVPGRKILLAGMENGITRGVFTDADTMCVMAKGIDALRNEILGRPAQREGA